MLLTLQEVQHIAELAKLNLTEEEQLRFQKQLSAVLDYAAELRATDTSKVSPTATVLPLRTVLRYDVPQPSLPRDELVKHPASCSAEFFKSSSRGREG